MLPFAFIANSFSLAVEIVPSLWLASKINGFQFSYFILQIIELNGRVITRICSSAQDFQNSKYNIPICKSKH